MRTVIIVCGERDWKHPSVISDVLDAELREHAHRWVLKHGHTGSTILSNFVLRHGAHDAGADALADAWGTAHRVTVERYPAQWRDENGYHPEAGPIRNRAMAKAEPRADRCLAFWSGKLRTKAGKKLYSGTFDMIQSALSEGIECRVIPPPRST